MPPHPPLEGLQGVEVQGGLLLRLEALQGLVDRPLKRQALRWGNQAQHHPGDRCAHRMALQGGEMLTVRGVAGLGVAPIRAEALHERLGHLPLE